MQKALIQKDSLVQSREFLDSEVVRTQKEYEAATTVAGKIDAFVNALLKFEEEAYENQAVDVLTKAYADTSAYRYKLRQDDIRIRQKRRRLAQLRQEGKKEEAQQFSQELLTFEIKVFEDRAANYPTDLTIKFELGSRQLLAGKLDEAIPNLQQAQREPKRRLTAMNLLGKAFAAKSWHRDAVQTFEKALQFDPSEDRAKELRYNLGRSHEAMGDTPKALDQYSHVAQMDYNYRDVRQRIEALRKAEK